MPTLGPSVTGSCTDPVDLPLPFIRVGEREHSSWCSTRIRCGRSKVARLVFADVTTKLQPQQLGEASQTFGDQRTGSRCKPVQSVELVCCRNEPPCGGRMQQQTRSLCPGHVYTTVPARWGTSHGVRVP